APGDHRIRDAELAAIPRSLLEVVADELVLAFARLEPRRELLVLLGARALRHRAVRRVADQRVAEAEAVLAGEGGPLRPHELLAHEREKRRGDLAPFVGRRELHHGAAPELLADDGRA